ncbi:hypothetical protein MUP77_09710, partial [Candidatus Bathyarchaeota archaeon]|nr:hypothetical protein [Candidatus Bathyarchaeota archaeon]
LCYQKPPACTLVPLPHAIKSLNARVPMPPGFAAGSFFAGRLCHDMISRQGRKRRMPKAASRKQTWDASPRTAVYGLRPARAFWPLAGVWEGPALGARLVWIKLYPKPNQIQRLKCDRKRQSLSGQYTRFR